MSDEIERKWIVDKVPENLSVKRSYKIAQGYLPVEDPENDEVRIRHEGNSYILSIKKGKGVKRSEVGVNISSETFEHLWLLTLGRRIEKTRYEILDDDGIHVIELDAYYGDLEGKVIAEVEFDTEEEAQTYKYPSWFNKEVTNDKRYKNKNVAVYGFPD